MQLISKWIIVVSKIILYKEKTSLISKYVMHSATETTINRCVPNSISVHRWETGNYNGNKRYGCYLEFLSVKL